MAARTRKSDVSVEWQQTLEQLEKWVSEGRPDLVRQDLVKHQRDAYGTPERVEATEKALDAACGKGPEHLIEVMFERMLRTCLCLQIRLECDVEPAVWSWWPAGGDPMHLQTEVLPAIERLQRQIMQITKAYASVKHTLNLSERTGEEDLRKQVIKLFREAAESTPEAGDPGRADVG